MDLVNTSAHYSHHMMAADRFCPNNQKLQVILYKQVLQLTGNAEKEVKDLFEKNGWTDAWTDSIFTYHHYHSTAHEVLAIIAGHCMLDLGGDDGNIQTIAKGDVIILPAGVAHKNVGSSDDFVCIGAYPNGQKYDMNYCKEEEMEQSKINIDNVPLPEKDPVMGDSGALVQLWFHKKSTTTLQEEKQF